ncbi:MAG: HlyC/CorC family transporter [Gammaproteobacteria bacterium]
MFEDSLFLLITILISLLVFSAFSSGSETGMMASNKVKLRNLAKGSKGATRAIKLLKRPDILLSAILVGNNFANILASAIVTILMLNFFGGNVLVGSIILTIVILIFSEITPKTIASVYPEKFAEKSSWLLEKLVLLFKPIIWLTNLVSSRLLDSLNIDPKASAKNDNLNIDELRTLLEEHGELIPEQSRNMLSGIIEMEDLVVEDCMVPVTEIIAVNLAESVAKAEEVLMQSDYSRLPVYEGSIDNILGILHLRNSHSFIEAFESGGKVKPLLDETYYVSQSTTINTQILEFLESKRNLGVVVDEYGEIQGLISIDDIYKEIVSKISHKASQEEHEIEIKKDGTAIVDGNTKVRDINSLLNLDLNEEGSKTLNGFLTDYIEAIPQNNICIEINDSRFEVLKIEENTITKIRISKK